MPNSFSGQYSRCATWCGSSEAKTTGWQINLLTCAAFTEVISSFLSYRTSQYKLHYYETPTNTKFVMLTDTKSGSMRIALQQIYVNCYVEYVVKNPLSPVEHPGGVGVNNELFEASLEQFVVRINPGILRVL
jgi:hypothetical protein